MKKINQLFGFCIIGLFGVIGFTNATECQGGPVYNCCVDDGLDYCDASGVGIRNNCFDSRNKYCGGEEYNFGWCQAGPGPNGAGAKCVMGPGCVSDGTKICQSPTERVDNCRRPLPPCSDNEICTNGECKPKDQCDPNYRSCNTAGNAQNQCGQVDTCKYGCEGEEGKKRCNPRPMCQPENEAIRKCVHGNIVNGCYDIIQACGANPCVVEPYSHVCYCPGVSNGKCNLALPGTCLEGDAKDDNYLSSPGSTRKRSCIGNKGTTDYCSIDNPKVPSDGVCGNEGGTCIGGYVEEDNNKSQCGETRTRKCIGSNGGKSVSCTKNNDSCTQKGVCATIADGYCSEGTKVLDNGFEGCGTVRKWYCQGENETQRSPQCAEQNPSCKYDGECGNAVAAYPYDATGWPNGFKFCLVGSPSTTPQFPSVGGSVTWTCPGAGGGSNTSCSASRTNNTGNSNGACGSAQASYSYSTSTWPAGSKFCAAGNPTTTPQFPGAGGSVSWTCPGVGGGSAATCNASRDNIIISNPGICGTAAKIFTETEGRGGSLCDTGTAMGSPSSPAPGGTTSWTCKSPNGGASATCEAKRQLNGKCSSNPGTCTKGSSIRDNNNAVPKEKRKWTCEGIYGGSNQDCEYINPGPCEVGQGFRLCTTTNECVPEGSFSSYCPPRPLTGAASASCKWIDPPTINPGEYLPIFWKMNPIGLLGNNLLVGVSDLQNCDSSNPRHIRKDKVMCGVTIKGPGGQVIERRTVGCYEISSIFNKSLFGAEFVDSLGVAKSLFTSKDGGFAYQFPTNGLSIGEYSVSIDKVEYQYCELVKDRNRPIMSTDGLFRDYENIYKLSGAKLANPSDCQNNFVVSKPYLSTQNNSLVSIEGAQLSDFKEYSSGLPISQSSVGTSEAYKLSSSATQLVSTFIAKQKQLATNGKIPNKNVWVNTTPAAQTKPSTILYEGDANMTSSQLLNLSPMTMLIVNGTLTIKVDGSFCKTQTPQFNGILIAGNIKFEKNSQSIFNDNLDKTRCSNGHLKISGLLFNTKTTAKPFETLRSLLGQNRFSRPSKTDPAYNSTVNKLIHNGASILIENNPKLWLNLPPGTSEIFDSLKIKTKK